MGYLLQGWANRRRIKREKQRAERLQREKEVYAIIAKHRDLYNHINCENKYGVLFKIMFIICVMLLLLVTMLIRNV